MSTVVSAAASSGDPLSGLSDLFQTIQTNADNLDFSGALNEVGAFLATDHARFFDSQSDPNGDAWKPLSYQAIDSRWLRQLGGGTVGSGRFGKTRESEFLSLGFRPDETILIDTGALRISVTQRGSPNHVEHIDRFSLEYGTSLEYAAQHEFGAITRTYNERAERWIEIEIPPRPFTGWSDLALDMAANKVADSGIELLLANI